VLVSTFVVFLSETLMGVALPVLMTDLQVEASVGQWLTAGFLLTMSVVIPVTGFLIRRVSTRTLFATAMLLFSAGALLAAVAPGFGVLPAGRVVQTGGMAIMVPLLMTRGDRRGAVRHRCGLVAGPAGRRAGGASAGEAG